MKRHNGRARVLSFKIQLLKVAYYIIIIIIIHISIIYRVTTTDRPSRVAVEMRPKRRGRDVARASGRPMMQVAPRNALASSSSTVRERFGIINSYYYRYYCTNIVVRPRFYCLFVNYRCGRRTFVSTRVFFATGRGQNDSSPGRSTTGRYTLFCEYIIKHRTVTSLQTATAVIRAIRLGTTAIIVRRNP